MNERGIYLLYDPKVFVLPLVFFSLFLLTWNLFWLILFLMYLIFVIIFYRGGCTFVDEDFFLSPAHGEVIGITTTLDKDENGNSTGEETVEISIFLNIYNVHIQYAPTNSSVLSITHKDGVFDFVFTKEKGSNNERLITVFKFGNADIGNFTIEQVAGKVARSIINYREVGDVLTQGEPFGQIFLGSRINILVDKKQIDGELFIEEEQKLNIGDKLFRIKK
uniref:Phosphatidylserine decarboxylase n=1 Tax=viral metagenome TaxID=1070528 RepID=A0A6C0JAS9_9ZZZZ